jgi:hypothetical protein
MFVQSSVIGKSTKYHTKGQKLINRESSNRRTSAGLGIRVYWMYYSEEFNQATNQGN